jgi:hypothetical protein
VEINKADGKVCGEIGRAEFFLNEDLLGVRIFAQREEKDS